MLTRSGVGWRVKMKTSDRKIYLAWGARVAPRCKQGVFEAVKIARGR